MIDPQDYCREIESYLCRKNDGHLIRIVGPAFEQVSEWAREGIPLKIAFAGVDRYFARYYKKGPRRRPVRIEFCDADVRDAFDDWRRAVGVAQVAAEETAAPHTSGRRRSSLARHIERALARLTAARGRAPAATGLSEALDQIVRQLDVLRSDAQRARGDARLQLTLELDQLDRLLVTHATAALTQSEHDDLLADVERELAPFRSRMLAETWAKTTASAFERLVRERFGLPTLRYE